MPLSRYFYHSEKEISSWEHPSDKYFRKLVQRCKFYQEQYRATRSSAVQDPDAAKQIEILRQKNSELRSAGSKMALEKEAAEAEASRLAQEMQELKELHSCEIAALKAVSVDVATRAAEIPALQADRTALQQRVEELQRQLQAQTDKLSSLLSRSDQNRALQERLRAVEEELSAAQAQLVALQREAEEQRAQATRDAAAAAEAARRASDAEERHAQERRSLSEAAGQLRAQMEEQALAHETLVCVQVAIRVVRGWRRRTWRRSGPPPCIGLREPHTRRSSPMQSCLRLRQPASDSLARGPPPSAPACRLPHAPSRPPRPSRAPLRFSPVAEPRRCCALKATMGRRVECRARRGAKSIVRLSKTPTGEA